MPENNNDCKKCLNLREVIPIESDFYHISRGLIQLSCSLKLF